jgi:alcohol dehydrogenase
LLWDRNITITTRLVDTSSMPMILRTVRAGKIDPRRLISHHFKLSNIIEAYETFATAEATGALKVLLEA